MFLLPAETTATAEPSTKQGLNQILPGVYMSFRCVFNMTLTLPIKPHSSSVSAFTAASPGKRGITRHSEAHYEGAYDGSYEGQFTFHGGPGIPQGIWRNLRGGRESKGGGEGRRV